MTMTDQEKDLGGTGLTAVDGISVSVHTPELPHDEPDAEREYSDEFDGCSRCDGSGVILVCMDDMCHGAGECMHGDGEIACPQCGGEGSR
jgi:hypothetical protein